MNSFRYEEITVDGYERVVFAECKSAGLRSIIAVHNTNRGPACGGIRMLSYQTKEDALQDVLRLAQGMSYKSALAELGFGGGKSVIIGSPSEKSPELFYAFGEFVNSLNGSYLCAKDMNISSVDLMQVKKTTQHVLGIEGIEGSSGDPSPVTARGIFCALKATAKELNGTQDLKGLSIAIQGIGHVGYSLAEWIVKAGGKVWVSDVDTSALERAHRLLGAEIVDLEKIYDLECDIFAPCARGAILNSQTISRLKCKAVVGCANNQLANESDGYLLQSRKILYAPDFAINSGGIINIFIEFEGYDKERALNKADKIYDTLTEIYRRSRNEQVPPFVVAKKLAEERLYGDDLGA